MKQQLNVFYGDFENAFDKLVHRIFVQKLWTFGIEKKQQNGYTNYEL